jgi:hypothetical protein
MVQQECEECREMDGAWRAGTSSAWRTTTTGGGGGGITVVVWDSDDDDNGSSREKCRSGAYRVTSGNRQVWEIRASRIGVGPRLNGDCREGIPKVLSDSVRV